MSIFKHIEKSLQQKLPFVCYRKPKSNLLTSFFQKKDTLITTSELNISGFIFAPFDDKKEAVIFPKESSDYFEEHFMPDRLTSITIKNTEDDIAFKESYIKLVNKGINAINNGEFSKVVLSRKESIKLSNFNILSFFKKLLIAYPNAFVSVWFHPKVGLWLGATPETLVKINQNKFESMSLAGTLPFSENTLPAWSFKEIEEQQLVTDYIIEKLFPLCKDLSFTKAETFRAGSLLHLKTKIKGTLLGSNTKLIKTLHPTPAVCGLPKNSAKKFILENEHYKRSFYSGFLGELNLNNNTDLYVNLRCIEIKHKTAFVYVGGGITKDSNPESEWKETLAKAKVMKKILFAV